MEKLGWSVEEARKSLGDISRSSMYALVHQEGFPVVRIGKRIIIPVDALKEWLKKNGTGEGI